MTKQKENSIENESNSTNKPYWFERVANHLFQKKPEQALKLLASIINSPPSLFDDDPMFSDEKQIAVMMRISILEGNQLFHEALAWILYEIDINPTNIMAHSMRVKLRKILNLDESKPGEIENIKKSIEWPDVAGMRSVKSMLERDVILPFQEPELFRKYKLTPPNGILFFGPPGCGKTHIARAVAKKSERHFIEIKPSDLGSIYIHGTQGKIANMFKEAISKIPCLLFLDEFDSLVPVRGGAGGHYDKEVNEFLVHLNNCAENGILVIGATNLLSSIDPAVKRPGRMDKKIFIGLPDIEARFELFHMCLKGRPIGSIDFHEIAKKSDSLTAAEIIESCNEAARMALEKRKSITNDDILKSITDTTKGGFSNNPKDWE
ncbi:MAG: ATP-binding protein [Magnetococcus sp. YQC-5]